MEATPALFPEPEVPPPALSVALGAPVWRLLRGQQARWTRIRPRTIDCQECAHLQHEQHGSYGPRRQAKHRRVVAGRGRLDLCHAHALAWRHRDEDDSAGHPAPQGRPPAGPTSTETGQQQ